MLGQGRNALPLLYVIQKSFSQAIRCCFAGETRYEEEILWTKNSWSAGRRSSRA
ncbi:hypothetical protein SELSPUOL_02006 [Selenomonas sputigena ATCC 35185]|uniref:Uncharacterized protein n=1 Tax=Selenomonas sputigena (strain ATCC 35185 / DSM 20758 / CCUG 44933 / VPI D19B-28) TaxID=546271 RepID=C9LX00_SELS3|nr:hypothetical protein SELSPUOL_02006 [Selenomonas sputigena ATCC 35185]